MTEIVEFLDGSIFTSFVDSLLGLLQWAVDIVVGIFTGINTLIGYAASNINSLVSVFTSNSGVMTMVNSAWGAIPSSFKALFILMIVLSAVVVMVRRI